MADGSDDPSLPMGEDDDAVFPGLDDGTWKYWLEKNVILWVAKDPYGFLYTVFLCLTPLFIISAILSYILMKDIDKKEKDKKRKAKRDSNFARARGRTSKKTDWLLVTHGIECQSLIHWFEYLAWLLTVL